ncbi:plasmolipin [Diaphorina citri]|uniref:Plasmolipin n=1 Tax=Diaphorina citri TaxID=121845 RepID=A0A3Q0JKV3_DIACI|nr:plasmolipin [Diaphorina citri]XP_026689029.1 plasmolipin [Diaphorina citri]
MAELSYGGHNTTTTTVTSTSTSVQTDIRFDDTYLRTVPGLLKIIQIVLNLIGFILISMSMYSMYFRANFFNTVAMFGFWFTGILLVLYLFHIIEKLYKIPWLKIVSTTVQISLRD